MIERIVVLVMTVGLFASMAQAGITAIGDVVPADPATWTTSTWAYIGKTGVGSVTVDDDSDLLSGYSRIGDNSGSNGAVTVSGAGSTWINSSDLTVAGSGHGTLDITDGGTVSNTYGYIGKMLGTGVVTVSGAGAEWTSTRGVYVGDFGDGTLEITNGGLVFSNTSGYLGFSSGSTGSAMVSGGGSIWNNSSSLYVGYSGEGTLEITDGGKVGDTNGWIGSSVGSTGSVTISGAGAEWTNSSDLIVGRRAYGTLDISSGGIARSTDGYLGYQSDSTGSVTVSGVRATWTNSNDLYVGHEGDGALDIASGGTASNRSGYIGYLSGSTGAVTVSGVGSTWTNSSDLFVGSQGNGTLNIVDGGLVEVGEDTHVAEHAGSAGAINLDNGTIATGGFLGVMSDLHGTGTINTGGLVSDVDLVFDAVNGLTQTLTLNGPGQNITVNLDVDGSGSIGAGYSANGSMHISDGLAVQSTSGYLGYQSGSTGVVTVSGAGSTWNNSGTLSVGRYGEATLDITDGGTVRNVDGYVGRLTSFGTVMVSGDGSIWTNSGDLNVGRSSAGGTLGIYNGGLVSVGGGLTIDEDGDGDDFINMGSGGMLALSGDTDDSLGNFLDIVSGSDAIRYWDESSWGWADITGETPEEYYALSYRELTEDDLPGYTVLTVIPLPPASLGDANGDEIVDHEDLAIFNAQLGLRGPGMSCDFDGDDDVDLEDFAILRSYFGSGVVSAPGAEFAAVTPEPATMLLLAGGLPVLLRQRRRLSCHPSAPLRTDGG